MELFLIRTRTLAALKVCSLVCVIDLRITSYTRAGTSYEGTRSCFALKDQKSDRLERRQAISGEIIASVGHRPPFG